MLSNLSVRQFNDQLRPDHTDYRLRLPFHGLTGPDPGISQSCEFPADGLLEIALLLSDGGELHAAATTVSQRIMNRMNITRTLTLAMVTRISCNYG